MLSNFQIEYGTTGFRFKANHQKRVVGIYSLGWEKQTSTSYSWNGLKRGEDNIIIFQYTFSGRGEIEIENETYQLNKGDAFFVKIPSKHHYYLPSSSDKWEFIHFTLYGDEANHSYHSITNDLGHVFNLDLHSAPISIILNLLRDVSKGSINDAYEASSSAYAFLMELHRFALNLNKNKEWPESITKAKIFIDTNYAYPITLDDIVKASGLSKYHFTRLFRQTIHITPIQYLTKVRINKAIDLLKDDSLTIEEIAVKIGFSNGNYFSKVFRSLLGLPPGEFRNGKMFSQIDHFVGDH